MIPTGRSLSMALFPDRDALCGGLRKPHRIVQVAHRNLHRQSRPPAGSAPPMTNGSSHRFVLPPCPPTLVERAGRGAVAWSRAGHDRHVRAAEPTDACRCSSTTASTRARSGGCTRCRSTTGRRDKAAADLAGRPPGERVPAGDGAARARRPHPLGYGQDRPATTSSTAKRHQAGAGRPGRPVDVRRSRVQLAAAPPAGDVPAGRRRDRASIRRRRSRSGAPTTTRSSG